MAVIALIHDSPTPTASDTALHDFLEARGHTVDMSVESATTAVSSSTYDAVVISESGSPTAVDPYVDWPNGVLCFETATQTLGLTAVALSTGTTSTDIDLTGSHEINSGFADPLAVFDAGQNIWGVATSDLSASVTAIALQPGTATRALAFVAEAGVTNASAGRRAGFGLIATRPGSLNSTGQDYVNAIVEWLVASGATEVNIGQVTESDTAQTLARRKDVTLGLVTETDAAQTVIRAYLVGQAVEQDATPSEPTDHALPVTVSMGDAGTQVNIGLVAESDTAQAVGKSKSRTTGPAAETDEPQTVARLHTYALAQATETDAAQAVTHSKARTVAPATETDASQTVAHSKAYAVGLVAETDTAQAAAFSRSYPVNQATGSDTAQLLTRSKVYGVGQVSESDTAQTVAVSQTTVVNLGVATETDTAQNNGAALHLYAVPLDLETDTAQQTGKAKAYAMGLAW